MIGNATVLFILFLQGGQITDTEIFQFKTAEACMTVQDTIINERGYNPDRMVVRCLNEDTGFFFQRGQ